MTIEEKAAYLASHGVTVYHLWDWMDIYSLDSMEATIAHYWEYHYA